MDFVIQTNDPGPSIVRVGVDVGQKQDPTAIVVTEHVRRANLAHYLVRSLERLPLGTSYPLVADRVDQVMQRLQAKAQPRLGPKLFSVELIIDATGVGLAIGDMLRERGLSPKLVLFTGSEKVSAQSQDTLLLGAQGAWMGTRFVTSHEWGGPSWEQEAVLAATADDTVQTRLYDLIGERPFPADNPDRVLRNSFIDRWIGRESEIPANREALQTEVAAGGERADLAVAGVSAGVSSGLITSARPAGEIVRDIVREAEHLLRERPRMLLG